ncbi:hypothetical protein KVR01_001917 [Diaporthe batatas]|uniref:uncharacterized protein n=1 Tax=Diaporthe batatas TaxID=748121 RepID=UPI001D05BBF0|nr:uncharacterized protein KVR01_001917 [Diaporthe batatas]KAG8169168.1 hypothetical protein KVR01_001917 [Diaporthe batatas]
MADPLSIAASIAGVISLADVVFIRTRKYLNSVKDADDEVKDFAREVLLLGGALHSLSKLAQGLDAGGITHQSTDDPQMHYIQECNNTLDEVAKQLKRFQDCKVIKKLAWPFKSNKMKEVLAKISRHKENINLALTADSMGGLLQALSIGKELQKNTEKLLEDTKKTREIVTRIHQDSEREKVIKYFLRYNPQQNYEMSCSLRHPRTGLWLAQSPQLQTWLQRPGSALWLSGIPGAGKTVLAGIIIREALKKSSEDVATVFFFCDYKDTTTQTTENILSALASQLAIQKEEAYACLGDYYRELHPPNALERRPDVPGLQTVLINMIDLFKHVHLIVDGLDECGENTDNVMRGVLDILECRDNLPVSTALLSRDEHNIASRLENFTQVEIAAHTADITEYVTSEIEKRISNKSLRIDNLSLKGEIIDRLVDGAKGMFRWVACQLDILGDCASDKECRESLGKLPPSLYGSYQRILERVPEERKRLAQMVLNFIAFPKPRMDTRVLREVLSVPENLSEVHTLELNSNSVIREEIISKVCRSLIRKSNGGGYYEFAHFSVLEFLKGEMKTIPELEAFQVSESICQLLLAKQCLNYLLCRNFTSLPTERQELLDYIEERDIKHPFYTYAALFWPILARNHWGDDGLLQSAKVLFQPEKTGNFTTWTLELAYTVSSGYESPYRSIFMDTEIRPDQDTMVWLLPQLADRNFTTLHMAAALSLEAVCANLIDVSKLSIDQRSSFGCPLQCAVQSLVFKERGYYPDEYQQCDYWDGQMDISGFGRKSTINRLINSGAEHVIACSSPFAGQTLITVAVKVGRMIYNMSVVGILLAAGYKLREADLSEFADFSKSALEDPFCGGSDEYRLEGLIRSLTPIVRRSDESTLHFRLCQAAWWLAIEMGCEFTRQPFTGIVDTRISTSRDALAKTIFKAVRNGDLDTLAEAVKDSRANIASLTDDSNKTIFEYAFDNLKDWDDPFDALQIIKLLVSSGIEVNEPNRDGLLPIHSFARLQWDDWDDDDSWCNSLLDILSVFISRGTDCTAQTFAKQNIFHLGCQSLNFIRAVLRTETQHNILEALRTPDENKDRPIEFAISCGHQKATLLLLETCYCDPESLGDAAGILGLCVAQNARDAFNVLRRAGIGSEADMAPLLHHVGPKTSKELVLELVGLLSDGEKFQIDSKLPLDAYLEACILGSSRTLALNTDVFQLLAAPEPKGLSRQEKQVVWKNISRIIRDMRLKKETYQDMKKWKLETFIAKTLGGLTQLEFIQSYEAVTNSAAILPLIRNAHATLDGLWPVSSETLCKILEHTTIRNFFRESKAMQRLLKAAVSSHDAKLLELLLQKGVSVHERRDSALSALEKACLDGCRTGIFTLLLDHADSSRLDEVNPEQSQGKGLIHYLTGPGKVWQLEELLKRGVNVNLCTNVHVQGWPAVVLHLLEGSSQSAMTLLDSGADPTAASISGIDAALAAAWRGDLSFLRRLQRGDGHNWQIDWQRTFSSNLPVSGLGDVNFGVKQLNALHLAAWTGECDALRFYMDNGLLTDVNAMSLELMTPIYVAALNGHMDAIKLLYSRGGDINLKSADGSLPLHAAVRMRRTQAVRFLVENGSDMGADTRGLSPIEYAIQLQDQSIIDCLSKTKQYLAYQAEVRKREHKLSYAYEQALLRGDVNGCELLRSQGCPVNIDLPHQYGRSALMLAIENLHQELIKWLLANGAKAAGLVRTMTGIWMSPLQAMIMRPQLNTVLPLLLHQGQSENGSVFFDISNLIFLAIQNNNNLGLELVLDHFARHRTEFGNRVPAYQSASWVNQPTLQGERPLHLAASRGNAEAVKLLLNYDADVNTTDGQRMTPLQRAIAFEPSMESPAARLLLRCGTALEHRNEVGETALMIATKRGNGYLARSLHDAGADLRAADFHSQTCLHHAASTGRLDLFVWLVNHGLDLNAKNSLGWSAIQYASWNRVFSSFILNSGCVLEAGEAVTYANPGNFMRAPPAFLNEHFELFLRRLGLDRLRAWANFEPTDSWSPLCMSASMNQTLAVMNILRLGAEVDFEGCPCGSALMVACSSGSLDSVKALIRHGASISYIGGSGNRSAVDAAKGHKAILAWLLVERFTGQRKISDSEEGSSSPHVAHMVKPWGGSVKAEMVITGTFERQVNESSRDYWIRLMGLKRSMRGRVVRQDTGQTHRLSRLIPEEPVRICPGYYGVSEEQN